MEGSLWNGTARLLRLRRNNQRKKIKKKRERENSVTEMKACQMIVRG